MTLHSGHFKHLSNPEQAVDSNSDWDQNGFIKLEGFFQKEKVEEINRQMKDAINKGDLEFNYTGKKILYN